MKKILIFLFLILLTLVIVIIFISRRNIKSEVITNQNNPSITINPLKTTETGFKPVSTNQNINVNNIIKKLQVLSKNDIEKINKIKSSLPDNADFSVVYSPLLNRFFISKKTANADQKIQEWINNSGLNDLVKNQSLFIITDKNGIDLKNEQEQKFIQYHDTQRANQDSPLPTLFITNVPNSTGEVGQLTALTDLLKIILNTPLNISPFPTSIPARLASESVAGRQNPTSNPPNLSLYSIFQEAGQKVGVPAKILEGIMRIENQSVLNYSNEQVGIYSQAGNGIPNCKPANCSDTGPMQFTTGIDGDGNTSCPKCGAGYCPNTWSSYGSTINNYGYTHSPNPCNLKDSIFAAAKLLKDRSGASSSDWSQDEVFRAAQGYHGKCNDNYRYSRLAFPGNSNPTYCEYLWYYYKNL